MGIRVYLSGSYRSGIGHEKEEATTVIENIASYFVSHKEFSLPQWCYVIPNIYLPEQYKANIDMLVIMPGLLYILELKDIAEAVIGKIDKTTPWTFVDKLSRTVKTVNAGKHANPFAEVRHQREAFAKFLCGDGLAEIRQSYLSRRADQLRDVPKWVPVLGAVQGRVVFQDLADKSQCDNIPYADDTAEDREFAVRTSKWFRVLRMNDVACDVTEYDNSTDKYGPIDIDEKFVEKLLEKLRCKPARKGYRGKVEICDIQGDWPNNDERTGEGRGTEEEKRVPGKADTKRQTVNRKTRMQAGVSLIRLNIVQAFIAWQCNQGEWKDVAEIGESFACLTGQKIAKFIGKDFEYISGTPRGRRMFRWKADGQLMVGAPTSVAVNRIDDLYVVMRQYVNQKPEDIPFEALSTKYQVTAGSLYIAYLEALKAYGGRA